MKKPLVITVLTAVAAIAAGAAAPALALSAFGGSIDDPAVAPCRRPPTTMSRATRRPRPPRSARALHL